MAEVVQGGGRKHKGKKRARMGVRLDMTPMVDVAFLLLTFFMLTTTLLTPQVMEIVMPPDSKIPVEIAQSNLLTLRIRA
ncbi:MAG TPA: biopolymer transporter ExbD, partial [Candidatus Kapabacteria bacterium]|nr:biopolymer transporter ExbD [Candidatus Kapabacteria bacterium]